MRSYFPGGELWFLHGEERTIRVFAVDVNLLEVHGAVFTARYDRQQGQNWPPFSNGLCELSDFLPP